MTWKQDNDQTGEVATHVMNVVPGNETQKYFRDRRQPVAYSLEEMSYAQLGEKEFTDDLLNLTEGVKEGKWVITSAQAPGADDPLVEYSVALTERGDADMAMLNYWLSMQTYVNVATLQIFGDISGELRVGALIAVLLYLPDPTGKLTKIHWTSSIWRITRVDHTIAGGSITTTLALIRGGLNEGSRTSEAAALHNIALEDLTVG
jgi:hypothetical protein